MAQDTPSRSYRIWTDHLDDEVDFWRRLAAGQLPEKRADWQARFDPRRPIQEYVLAFLPEHGRERARILDVGAGPATTLGKLYQGHRLDITPVDPLAVPYAKMLHEFGLTPPIPTLPCHAEKLVERFGAKRFDVVYSRNALDHSYDPSSAFRQIVTLLKPGRSALVECFAREAEHEGYGGLHQWNIDIAPDPSETDATSGDIALWTRDEQRILLSGVLGRRARVEGFRYGAWLYIWLHRRAANPVSEWLLNQARHGRRERFLEQMAHVEHPSR